MSKLLSGFLNTTFSTFDSDEVIQIIGGGGGNVLGVNTSGDYIESALEGFGINITNSSGSEGANLTFSVDSSVIATVSSAQTLTNKTIDLSSNTITGNTAQFNAALSGDNFVTETASQTLTNKTLTLPTIGATGASFAGSSSGAINVQATAIAGTNTITLPAVTGTLVTEAGTATLTNKTISGSNNTISNIPNSATTATSANTANAIVARDASGNFTAGTITANLTGKVSGPNLTGNSVADLVTCTVAGSDFVRIRAGGDGDNAGWLEIATADDGTEPIYVRQYSGTFTTVTRTATLLDGSGNTSFPGVVSAGSQVAAFAYGNDYNNASFQAYGNGSANTIFPSIGFHQPNVFASSIQLRGAGDFRFYNQGAGSFANITCNVLNGTATSARYADLAEKYLADNDYPVGTVMCVGGEAEVTASTPSLAHSIVGVVSEHPAHLMNDALEGGTAVALKGRVPVRIVGLVNKGDRLTVSDIPGCAKANNDAKWTFAIALHSSDSGIVEAIIL